MKSEIENANEVTAIECGVKIGDDDCGYKFGRQYREYPWSIEDPRCREIVREHYRIVTNCDEVTGMSNDEYEWETESCVQLKDYISCKTGYGNTIKEAEIAIILKIVEVKS